MRSANSPWVTRFSSRYRLSASTGANIGESDTLSRPHTIGGSYIRLWQPARVAKRPTNRTFWLRVKDAMKAHPRYRDRATQTEAARVAGVEQPTVSDWNKEGRVPELTNGIRLAEKLNVCIEWLYMERGPMHPLPAEDEFFRELMRVWDALDDEGKRKIVNYAQVSAAGSPFAAEPNEPPQSQRAQS